MPEPGKAGLANRGVRMASIGAATALFKEASYSDKSKLCGLEVRAQCGAGLK